VTGSTAGLGEAIVKLLAAEGVDVVVHGRSESRATAVAEAIRSAGGSAEIAQAILLWRIHEARKKLRSAKRLQLVKPRDSGTGKNC
jgi:NADP-dependent 3-hydroxy acid dehydrogenase YdfG